MNRASYLILQAQFYNMNRPLKLNKDLCILRKGYIYEFRITIMTGTHHDWARGVQQEHLFRHHSLSNI